MTAAKRRCASTPSQTASETSAWLLGGEPPPPEPVLCAERYAFAVEPRRSDLCLAPNDSSLLRTCATCGGEEATEWFVGSPFSVKYVIPVCAPCHGELTEGR